MDTEVSSGSVNHCIGCLRLSVFSLFCQSLSLIVETLMKLLKHLRPFGGIIVVSWTAVCLMFSNDLVLNETIFLSVNYYGQKIPITA